MSDVPTWRLSGDWFDVCNCNIACPCTFTQTPTYGKSEGVNFWHIREGRYGDVGLDGLNALALIAFEGNIWAGGTKMDIGIFFDEGADVAQREALQMVFSGQAGGWPAALGDLIGAMRGVEFVPIECDISDDLEWWSVSSPGGSSPEERRSPARQLSKASLPCARRTRTLRRRCRCLSFRGPLPGSSPRPAPRCRARPYARAPSTLGSSHTRVCLKACVGHRPHDWTSPSDPPLPVAVRFRETLSSGEDSLRHAWSFVKNVTS
jgi:hypothetical protein